jgi:hypothetical protein
MVDLEPAYQVVRWTPILQKWIEFEMRSESDEKRGALAVADEVLETDRSR